MRPSLRSLQLRRTMTADDGEMQIEFGFGDLPGPVAAAKEIVVAPVKAKVKPSFASRAPLKPLKPKKPTPVGTHPGISRSAAHRPATAAAGKLKKAKA